jgi:hypothetical protein
MPCATDCFASGGTAGALPGRASTAELFGEALHTVPALSVRSTCEVTHHPGLHEIASRVECSEYWSSRMSYRRARAEVLEKPHDLQQVRARLERLGIVLDMNGSVSADGE